MNHREPPRALAPDSVESFPVFLSNEEVLFESQENGHTYAFRRRIDSAERHKAISATFAHLETISPDNQWLVAEVPVEATEVKRGVAAINLQTGETKRICYGLCLVRWSLDGTTFNISLPGNSGTPTARTFVIHLPSHQSFPPLPPEGFKSEAELARLTRVLRPEGFVWPGPDSSRYAVDRTTVHRNIFRIPLS